jgi:hypothetical protein
MKILAVMLMMITMAGEIQAQVELPDPFLFVDGSRVANQEDWPRRREELREQILKLEYGQMPPAPGNTTAVLLLSNEKKRHFQYKIYCGPDHKISFVMDLLLPEGKGPFPVILRGDWCWGDVKEEIAKQVLDRGYALANFNRLELSPDLGSETALLHGVYPDRKFGALAAWAWGFHRCVDVLVTLDSVDNNKIAITGHSRGGKATLLAGAMDERIALTAPNASGTGGGDCFRVHGKQTEGIARITKNFPRWFTPEFKQFAGQEEKLPFDQHCVMALCAPRALLVTEAMSDQYTNPHGTYQNYRGAREVFQFFGQERKIAMHVREGEHAHQKEDWDALLDFADFVLKGKAAPDWTSNAKGFEDTLLFKWAAPGVN